MKKQGRVRARLCFLGITAARKERTQSVSEIMDISGLDVDLAVSGEFIDQPFARGEAEGAGSDPDSII